MKSLRERYDHFVIQNTPTCSEIVITHSRALDEFVSPFARLRVRWHAASCLYCQRYFDQLKLVRRLLKGESDPPSDEPESIDLRERVKSGVRDRLRSS